MHCERQISCGRREVHEHFVSHLQEASQGIDSESKRSLVGIIIFVVMSGTLGTRATQYRSWVIDLWLQRIRPMHSSYPTAFSPLPSPSCSQDISWRTPENEFGSATPESFDSVLSTPGAHRRPGMPSPVVIDLSEMTHLSPSPEPSPERKGFQEMSPQREGPPSPGAPGSHAVSAAYPSL